MTGPDAAPPPPAATPPRFVERRDRGAVWRVDAELAGALEALGWPGDAAVAAAFSRAASEGRAATALLTLPGRPERVHLRHVRHGGLAGPLWAGTIWGPGRPLAELEVTARLRASGAPVPRPLLVAARRRAGPLWSAVLGTLHVEDARDGLAWLAAGPAPAALLDGLRAVGRAIRAFHDAGGRHADLHLKNLLLRDGRSRGAGGAEALVIDLDRARADAPPDPARRLRELMRLLRSLHKRGVAEQVGARGCAAAFAAYCAGDRTLRRALLEHLPHERRRVALHARGYR